MSRRDDLIARLVLFEAAAKQIKAALKAEAEVEHRENGTTSTWRVGFARASGSETHDHVDVTDPSAFLDYLEARYPTEVETKLVRAPRNPEWASRIRENLAALHRADLDEIAEQGVQVPALRDAPPPIIRDEEGTEVPGVTFVPGGQFLSVSVTPSLAAKVRAREAARAGAMGGDWSVLEGLLADPARLKRALPAPLDEDDKRG